MEWRSPLFPVNGPFGELANIALMFVIVFFGRMIVSIMSLAWIETCCHRGAFTKEERKKIASNAWYCVYYFIAFASGSFLLFRVTGWADKNVVCTYGDPVEDLYQYPLLHVYHCMQVAFYINYLFSMFTGIDPEKKKGDHWMYVLHHIVTICLILFSRNWGYMRIQLAVFVVHDAADPFLHLSKLVKYARPNWKMATDFLLVLFAVTFYVTRLIVYPVQLIEPCRSEWTKHHPVDWYRDSNSNDWFEIGDSHLKLFGYSTSHRSWAMISLYTLFVLHVLWGLRIFRVAWTMMMDSNGSEKKKQQQQPIRQSRLIKINKKE